MQNDNDDNGSIVSGGGSDGNGDNLGGDDGDVAASPSAAEDLELPGMNMTHVMRFNLSPTIIVV